MRRQIKIASFIAFVTLSLMIFGIIKSAPYTSASSRGDYFFEKTKSAQNVQSIVLKSFDHKVVTIEKNGNLWRIKEVDDYFADLTKINTLVKLIRGVTVYRSDHTSHDSIKRYITKPISIISYSNDKEIIDETFIEPKQQNNKFNYALRNRDSFLYQIQGDFDLSFNPIDWIKTPLLEIPYNEVKHLKTDNFDVFRRFPFEELKTVQDKKEVPQVQNIINKFRYLVAEDIQHAVHFDSSRYKLVKNFELTDMNGLIYNIYVFSNDTDYWLKIMLDREKIISRGANSKLKETAILYDGWFFRINSDIGKELIGFIL